MQQETSEYIMSPLSMTYNTNYACSFTRMQEFQLKEKLDPILAFYQLAQELQAIHYELDFNGDINPQNIFYKNNIMHSLILGVLDISSPFLFLSVYLIGDVLSILLFKLWNSILYIYIYIIIYLIVYFYNRQ